jgi:DNA repair protein RadC
VTQGRLQTASLGTTDAAPFYPREIMRRGLDLGASGLIVAHNHPSGRAAPSRTDLELTRKLVRAGDTLGIAIHDHLVLAGDDWTSMRATGQL